MAGDSTRERRNFARIKIREDWPQKTRKRTKTEIPIILFVTFCVFRGDFSVEAVWRWRPWRDNHWSCGNQQILKFIAHFSPSA
jgi:hypothetical protein